MKRLILLGIGWVCVGLAFIGVFVPGIPTTIFLIVALWAFARSSKVFHSWLLNHKKFGPILNNWQTHKVVPPRAKILMVDIGSLNKNQAAMVTITYPSDSIG